ncbi:MAG: hypothetical protein ACJ72D_16185 [Marmoricola sp.]
MTSAPDHDGDLRTRLREHVAGTEPAFTLSPDRAAALGRRTLKRRRIRRGLAGAAVLGAAAVTLPALVSNGVPAGDRGSGYDPATVAALKGYDASQMPTKLRGAADPVVETYLPALSGTGAFRASDDQGVALPEKYWDKASGMDLRYGGQGTSRLRVSLLHSRSEAEGDARKNCENDVETGYAFSCEVSTVDGDVVTARVFAVRKMDGPPGSADWGAVTRGELRTGDPVPGDPSQRPIDPDEIYFLRSVESVHSSTFLSVAEETVKAPSYQAAAAAFSVPVDALSDLVTDPALVIPVPPKGENGCAWMLHPENMSCGVKAPKGS